MPAAPLAENGESLTNQDDTRLDLGRKRIWLKKRKDPNIAQTTSSRVPIHY
jgi:hypothetical protein